MSSRDTRVPQLPSECPPWDGCSLWTSSPSLSRAGQSLSSGQAPSLGSGRLGGWAGGGERT